MVTSAIFNGVVCWVREASRPLIGRTWRETGDVPLQEMIDDSHPMQDSDFTAELLQRQTATSTNIEIQQHKYQKEHNSNTHYLFFSYHILITLTMKKPPTQSWCQMAEKKPNVISCLSINIIDCVLLDSVTVRRANIRPHEHFSTESGCWLRFNNNSTQHQHHLQFRSRESKLLRDVLGLVLCCWRRNVFRNRASWKEENEEELELQNGLT